MQNDSEAAGEDLGGIKALSIKASRCFGVGIEAKCGE